MNDNKKFLVIISLMLLVFSATVITIVGVNFRNFVIKQEIKKAKTIANLVKDGLTSHMAAGIMSKRELFLNNVKKSTNALKIWIFRTNKVVKLFGKGFANEYIRDDIDKKVIATGKEEYIVKDGIENSTLRVTIPYIATSKGEPDCLKCHTNAKEGDVLGGISMEFDLSLLRFNSIFTIFKIILATFITLILFIFITNRLLKPYIGTLTDIKNSLKKANNGDYSCRIKVKNGYESSDASRWLNALLEKLEKTIGAIEKNISLFVTDRSQKFQDPLDKSQQIIKELADIYRFKRTIEEDKTKDIIYQRLIKIFKEKLKISDLSLYEVDKKNDIRYLIYDDTPEKFCDKADRETSKYCRAYRTNSIVASDDFEDICQVCKTTKEYFCVNFMIDETISLILNIKPKTKDELIENKKSLGYIRNYLESAKPILQSKILNEILHKSNQIDGLTKLYNRKYLNNFTDKVTLKHSLFAIAMLDIDYFKKVNDTYGHDAGDVVLRGLSEIFRSDIGEEDIAFRFGGEEFVIFLPKIEDAYSTIKNIKDHFENTTFQVNNEDINKTLSAGIAYFPADCDSIWKAIKCADIALYEAKNSGRNKIIEYKNISLKNKQLFI